MRVCRAVVEGIVLLEVDVEEAGKGMVVSGTMDSAWIVQGRAKRVVSLRKVVKAEWRSFEAVVRVSQWVRGRDHGRRGGGMGTYLRFRTA